MKNLKILIATMFLIFNAVHCIRAAAPVVTNVVASQRSGTKLVDIRYDVSDADGDLLTIRLLISNNSGTNYSVPANSLTGDFGNNIAPGTNKLMVWNAGVDWDGEYSPQMRVKVIASDNKGYPGLQWGQEVPPGGFFMGQDGGVEGVGTGKHINIPYSFWLSKYEITVGQYCDFLNTALAAGQVTRNANGSINANNGVYVGVSSGTTIYTLGSDMQWNLNKVDVLTGKTNLPVLVNWYGATAFSQQYGYDLPTDAEWEKAARGADYDGLGEHRIYPWGNSITGGNANYCGSGDPYECGRTPIGYYNGNQVPFGPDMANGYGLYDITGNADEWTRSILVTHDSYPATESITNSIHSLTSTSSRVLRGGNYTDGQGDTLKCYFRTTSSLGSQSYGFRVTRRSP